MDRLVAEYYELSENYVSFETKGKEIIGTLIFFLSKDTSRFVNKIVIPVDGGFSADSGV